MNTDSVIVYSLPGAWGLPSASPFCLKLLTWLRMTDIPYKLNILHGPPKSATGKAPYIERADGSLLADSGFIIDVLGKERGVALDAHLSEQQRAIAHLLERTLEKSLYFVMVWNRWEQHWAVTRQAFFGSMPPLVRNVVPAVVRRSIRKQAQGQGVSLNSPAQIYATGCADVENAVHLLGDQEYFFGRPSSLDATAYGFFANLLHPQLDDPLCETVRSQPNIVAFCERMEKRYWSH